MHKGEKSLIVFTVISAIASLVIGVARTATVSELPQKKLDYERLANLLNFGALKKADRQTYRMMLIALDKTPKTLGEFVQITERDLAHFPCEDLQKLDQTWHEHTQGKYSFSIQRKIWAESKSTESFAQKVNWKMSQTLKNYNELTFNSSAISGHLPAAPSGGFIFVLSPDVKVKKSSHSTSRKNQWDCSSLTIRQSNHQASQTCNLDISAAIFTRMNVCQLPDLTAPNKNTGTQN